jgi:hypothetical protein
MAWSASKIFVATLEDVHEQTAASFDVNTDTFKAALYDNDITPDQTVASANTAYAAGQWVSASNEVFEAGQWAQAGVALSITSSFTSNVYTIDSTDTASGSAADLAAVFGCLVYNDSITTPVADQGLCYNYFGGSNSVVNGTFTVVWNAAGVMAYTL